MEADAAFFRKSSKTTLLFIIVLVILLDLVFELLSTKSLITLYREEQDCLPLLLAISLHFNDFPHFRRQITGPTTALKVWIKQGFLDSEYSNS